MASLREAVPTPNPSRKRAGDQAVLRLNQKKGPVVADRAFEVLGEDA